MAQDRITEDGRSASGSQLISYNLFAVADHLDLFHELGWIEKTTSEWLSEGIVVAAPPGEDGAPRVGLTRHGYEQAQKLRETVGAADGMLLKRGLLICTESAIAAELERALRQPTLRRLKSRTALGSLAEIVVASMILR